MDGFLLLCRIKEQNLQRPGSLIPKQGHLQLSHIILPDLAWTNEENGATVNFFLVSFARKMQPSGRDFVGCAVLHRLGQKPHSKDMHIRSLVSDSVIQGFVVSLRTFGGTLLQDFFLACALHLKIAPRHPQEKPRE